MAFTSRHPQVELKIFELGTKQMAEAMTDGTVETAAVMLPFDEQLFELHRFATDRLMLLVNHQHPLAAKTGELCGDYPRAVCVFLRSVPDKRHGAQRVRDLQHGTGGSRTEQSP